MNKEKILETILAISHDVFDDEDVDFTLDTLFKDIPEWDSLNHMHMVVKMEKAFGIRFQQAELQGLVRISDIVGIIAGKLAA
jgi:acyl carrier protein